MDQSSPYFRAGERLSASQLNELSRLASRGGAHVGPPLSGMRGPWGDYVSLREELRCDLFEAEQNLLPGASSGEVRQIRRNFEANVFAGTSEVLPGVMDHGASILLPGTRGLAVWLTGSERRVLLVNTHWHLAVLTTSLGANGSASARVWGKNSQGELADTGITIVVRRWGGSSEDALPAGSRVFALQHPATREWFVHSDLASPDGGGTDPPLVAPLIRFQLTEDLDLGGEAVARARMWNGAAYAMTGDPFTVRDATKNGGTWKGLAGYTGWCLQPSDRAGYEIVWMERIAERIEGTLSEDVEDGSAAASVVSYYRGVDPGSTAHVYDTRGAFADAKSGARYLATYDDRQDRYVLTYCELPAEKIRFKVGSQWFTKEDASGDAFVLKAYGGNWPSENDHVTVWNVSRTTSSAPPLYVFLGEPDAVGEATYCRADGRYWIDWLECPTKDPPGGDFDPEPSPAPDPEPVNHLPVLALFELTEPLEPGGTAAAVVIGGPTALIGDSITVHDFAELVHNYLEIGGRGEAVLLQSAAASAGVGTHYKVVWAKQPLSVGPPGPQGERGLQGPTGETGPQGPAGIVAAASPLVYTSGTQTIGHAASGVAAGTYANSNLTVDATGHVTAIANGIGGTRPVISIDPVANGSAAISTITLRSDRFTSGLPACIANGKVTFTKDGGANLLTGLQVITSSADGLTHTLSNLTNPTNGSGTYTLTFTAESSGVMDGHGVAPTGATSMTFTLSLAQWGAISSSFQFGYPFDDSIGGAPGLLRGWNASGLLDAANDLTNAGTVTMSTVGGRRCALFTSTSKSLYRSSIPGMFAANTDFTVALWHQKTTLGDSVDHYPLWFGAFGTGSDGMYVNPSTGGNLGFSINDDTAFAFNAAGLTNNTSWNHWCISRSGSIWKLYVNGSLIAAKTQATSVTLSGALLIGGYTGSTAFTSATRGGIQDVLVWSRGLSDSEVGVLWNSGNTLQPTI